VVIIKKAIWFFRIWREDVLILGCERATVRSHPKSGNPPRKSPKNQQFYYIFKENVIWT
jgi:hypothetical protein